MADDLEGNCLVAQSGGPTSVINASLAGVITEALNHECIEEVYGGLNGIQGILQEEIVDLAEESQQTIRGLRSTPASALSTCRFKLKKSQDCDRAIEIFQAHNIRYFFYIGGNDSQDTANMLSKLSKETCKNNRCSFPKYIVQHVLLMFRYCVLFVRRVSRLSLIRHNCL